MLSSREPLRTLREIVQNFPFAARSLSRTRPDAAIEASVRETQGMYWGPGYSGAFLNGRALPVVHKNDLAGLLRTLQRELHTVDVFSQLGLPNEVTLAPILAPILSPILKPILKPIRAPILTPMITPMITHPRFPITAVNPLANPQANPHTKMSTHPRFP